MNKTLIEWVQFTWNPITGCSPCGPGCQNCYAARNAKRFAGRFGYPASDPFRVTAHWGKMDEPLARKKPATIFVCSMGDLFHKDVPRAAQARIWQVMDRCPQHTFVILTKRPQHMRLYLAGRTSVLPNVWLGVSAEDQATLDDRVRVLITAPAAHHIVSCEPLLEHVSVGACLGDINPRLDWVIGGAETGSSARLARLDWFRAIRDECAAAGVSYFQKSCGPGVAIPGDLRVRQFPTGYDASWYREE